MTEETKFCKDCKHYKEGYYYKLSPGLHHFCKAKPLYTNKVTGMVHYNQCEDCRTTLGHCGYDALLFEPKPISFIDKLKYRVIIAYVKFTKGTK